MSITEILGLLLGLEGAQRIEDYNVSLGASWAQESPGWLFFGFLGLTALAAAFYARYQRQRHPAARTVLAVLRSTALCLLLLVLAQPILSVWVSGQQRPALCVLIDGTESMDQRDAYSDAERDKLDKAVGLGNKNEKDSSAAKTERRSRMEYIQALLQKDDGSLLKQLSKRFRPRFFLFEGLEGVRAIELPGEGRRKEDVDKLLGQLTVKGQVTALGAAIDDLSRREDTKNLAGLVIFSDFESNAGTSPQAAARAMKVPFYAVGVGAASAPDVSVTVQAEPLYVKKDEDATIKVVVRQQGLDGQGQVVSVRLWAERLDLKEGETSDRVRIGEKPVTLGGPLQVVDFPYHPVKAGRYNLIAETDVLPSEINEANNHDQRELTVLEDFLRLMYVEYEPTWEWRFIKEVFHRDKLVGVQGFRTYLRSSDLRVRQTNELFLPTMSPARSEFFANDVIFLGDMPASVLNASPRFCQMVEEFVRDFRGGLVVIAGPRFGPGQLADTPLAKLLPVVVSPGARISDRAFFRLTLNRNAEDYPFMQLAGEKNNTPQENQKTWDNLGPLQWYYPVERLSEFSRALAEHPTEMCADGKTRQPLIAIRPYGTGEVVYVGFNELWRMRRMYGEKHYRAFWAQLIHRLALRHALGSQKRFLVKTDRTEAYRPHQEVLLTVEAYDEEFHPLTEARLRDKGLDKLEAKWILPGGKEQPLNVTQVKDGHFEVRFRVLEPGEHRIRVTDPLAKEKQRQTVELIIQVADLKVEKQRPFRNLALQEQLAAAQPGGKMCDLTNVVQALEELSLHAKTESKPKVIPLWDTWLTFGLLVFLLLLEWLLRKRVNLP
jgi:hypothetical protein